MKSVFVILEKFSDDGREYINTVFDSRVAADKILRDLYYHSVVKGDSYYSARVVEFPLFHLITI